MDLSIIIPTKDRGAVFDRTLAELLVAIKDKKIEVIVVNDSASSTPAVPMDHDQVRLVRNPGAGVVSARNHGSHLAASDLLLFLDDDVLVSKRSIEQLLELHLNLPHGCTNVNWEYTPETNAELELTQFGRFIKSHGMNSHQGWYNHPSWRPGELFRTEGVASFHLCITKADFRAAGEYNAELPFAMFGDIDFPLRLKKAGIQPYIHAGITVYHNEVDKLHLRIWLYHWHYRSSYLRLAADAGIYELRTRNHPLRRLALRTMARTLPIWFATLQGIPNWKVFDPLYSRVLSAVQATHIFMGYNFIGLEKLHTEGQ